MSKKIISIKSSGRDEDQLLPYCPPQVYEELKKNFSLEYLVGTQHNSDSEKVGYMRGVLDVLTRIKTLAKYNDEE